jgi:hypothetical protein
MPTENHFFDEIAGVYKIKFNNGLISGEKYQSENILEIMPIDRHKVYIRMKLEFFNGHVGDIYGIATQKGNSLIYQNKTENCLVQWVWNKNNVTSHTDYTKYPGCSYFHGQRGTLDNIVFPIKNRRDIRYLETIRNSQEYKSAVREDHK